MKSNFIIENSILKRFIGNDKHIVVPNYVTEIAEEAFEESNIESIVISDSVEHIGYAAFRKCEKLKKVKLSKNLKEITSEMFCWCVSLSEIDIPKSVTVIEDYSFLQCRSLESIFLTSNITKIGANTFAGCINIRNSIFLDGEKINSKDECEVKLIDQLLENDMLSLDNDAQVILNKDEAVSLYELKCSIKNSIELFIKLHINLKRKKDSCIKPKEKNFFFKRLFAKKEEEIYSGFYIENNVLKSYYGDKTDIVIPAFIEKISERAFEYNNDIKFISLTKPNVIIPQQTFKCCNKLKLDDNPSLLICLLFNLGMIKLNKKNDIVTNNGTIYKYEEILQLTKESSQLKELYLLAYEEFMQAL